MGQGYILDSNVIIDLVAEKLPSNVFKQLSDSLLFTSVISRIEVLGFQTTKLEEEKFISLFEDLQTLSLTEEVVLKTILIRKTNKIKLGDAIIAATALVYDLKLLTRNVSDFKRIEGLEVLSSHD